jgi:hypothetical protein
VNGVVKTPDAVVVPEMVKKLSPERRLDTKKEFKINSLSKAKRAVNV